MTTTFRAAYFVTADGQGDICLTGEDQAHLSDAELVEAAVTEAREQGLIVDEYDADEPHLITEDMLRDGLRVGEYASRW